VGLPTAPRPLELGRSSEREGVLLEAGPAPRVLRLVAVDAVVRGPAAEPAILLGLDRGHGLFAVDLDALALEHPRRVIAPVGAP
jgi:hypothetical protein